MQLLNGQIYNHPCDEKTAGDEWTGICYGSIHCSSAHARSSNIAAC
jgi:hypothetical protein